MTLVSLATIVVIVLLFKMQQRGKMRRQTDDIKWSRVQMCVNGDNNILKLKTEIECKL